MPTMPPTESIQNANRLISSKSPNAMFVSLFYAQLEPGTGQITYVNAGHNPPLYYHAADERLERLYRTGMVLGIDPDTPYTQHPYDASAGRFLLLYTDGLPDAIDDLKNRLAWID